MKKNKKTIVIITVFIMAAGFIIWNSFASESNSNISENNKDKIVVYKDPNCGCCVGYVSYLKKQDFDTEIVNTRDMNSIKEQYGIPEDMESCHTTVIGDYFIEGHVPIEAINKLLEEKPDIDGIALPGMPSGSPGMPGFQRGPFNIRSLVDGINSEFIIID